MWIASSRFVSENNKESKIINYVARINSCPPPSNQRNRYHNPTRIERRECI